MSYLENPLVQRSVVALPTPAAGQGFTIPVSGAVCWRVCAVTFVLNTAAGGSSRVPHVAYEDGSGTTFVAVAAPFSIGGALSSTFSFGIGLQQFGANAAAFIGGPLPDVVLDVNDAVVVSIAQVSVGDQLGDIRLYVEQHNERP